MKPRHLYPANTTETTLGALYPIAPQWSLLESSCWSCQKSSPKARKRCNFFLLPTAQYLPGLALSESEENPGDKRVRTNHLQAQTLEGTGGPSPQGMGLTTEVTVWIKYTMQKRYHRKIIIIIWEHIQKKCSEEFGCKFSEDRVTLILFLGLS